MGEARLDVRRSEDDVSKVVELLNHVGDVDALFGRAMCHLCLCRE